MIQVADEFQILIKTAATKNNISQIKPTSVDSQPDALFYVRPAYGSLSMLLSLNQLDTHNRKYFNKNSSYTNRKANKTSKPWIQILLSLFLLLLSPATIHQAALIFWLIKISGSRTSKNEFNLKTTEPAFTTLP